MFKTSKIIKQFLFLKNEIQINVVFWLHLHKIFFANNGFEKCSQVWVTSLFCLIQNITFYFSLQTCVLIYLKRVVVFIDYDKFKLNGWKKNALDLASFFRINKWKMSKISFGLVLEKRVKNIRSGFSQTDVVQLLDSIYR